MKIDVLYQCLCIIGIIDDNPCLFCVSMGNLGFINGEIAGSCTSISVEDAIVVDIVFGDRGGHGIGE